MIPINIFSCDYPLPLPKELKEKFASIDWSEIVFLTPSICTSDLYRYSISVSGRLYLEDDGIEERVRQVDYTGEILLDCLIEGQDHDNKLFFKALFFKGDIKEITFEKIEPVDNSNRIEFIKKSEEKLKKDIANRGKWWYIVVGFLMEAFGFLLLTLRIILLLIIRGLEFFYYNFHKLEKWTKY